MKYKDGYEYQLVEGEQVLTEIYPIHRIATPWITLAIDGGLYVQAWYAWDGPSGPAMDTKSAMRGSLFHDALYQLLRLKLLPPSERLAADELYRKLCLEDGMWRIRAWAHFRVLRRLGGPAADPENQKPVLEAP